LSKETILLIEDNAENTEFMVDYLLTPNGYAPIVASDGRQGLEMALTEKPDLIILDFKLPGMSGIQILETLRERQVDIPVIFITAYGSEEDIVSCFRLGIKDYFRKPFDIERMLETVEKVLSENRQQKLQTAQHRELEEYIKELGTLYGSSLERVLNRIVEIAVALTGAEEGYLLLVDRQTDELYMRSALNLGERFAREFRIRIQDSITGRVVQTGEPVLYSSLDGTDRFKVKTGYLVKALINVPLRSTDRVIGVLGIDNRITPKAFTHADQELLCLLAEHAATAIENASLYGQTHRDLVRQVKEFLIMQDVARALNAIMDMEHIARLVLQYALRIAPAEAGLIGLTTSPSASGSAAEEARTSWTPHGYIATLMETGAWQPRWDTGVIGQATSSGRAVLISDAVVQEQAPDQSAAPTDSASVPDSRSRLVVPILRGGRVLGVIDLESTQPDAFSENNQLLLSTLADHAAGAIENTQLFDMVLDEQNRTKFILQSIAEGVYTVDQDLHILTFNPAAERITGWRADEVRGKLCSEVFCDAIRTGIAPALSATTDITPVPPDAHPQGKTPGHQEALIHQALREGMPVASGQDAPPILTRDGREVYISSSASPLRNRENVVVGSVIAFRDVSAERELDRLKSDFVSMVSHELRSPLASLSAAIELMLEPAPSGIGASSESRNSPDEQHPVDGTDPQTGSSRPGAVQKALQIARANAQRLNRLIENILSVSQIEANQIRVQLEPTMLLPIVRHTIRTIQAQTTRHQILLRSPESVPFALADQSKLEIVLHNLLTNAVNYSPNGGRILVRITRAVRNELVVSVIDEGIGISQEHITKLFTRFYRVDGSDGRDVYGHGLGLYISKHLIELMGGRIWARSKEGHGSCFSFTLPIVTEFEGRQEEEFLAVLAE
jgi:signal transduction histidine kinase/GAF domain-containing protein/ActR/RegA family two-component response regulator